MEQNTHSDETPAGEAAQGDLFNTAAGWALFAGIVGLGLSVVSGMYFHGSSPERPEQLGYVIEGVEEEGSVIPVEMTMAEALTKVTAADGEKVYAKCSSCHSIDAGGGNGVGPNLHAIMGASMAAKAGYQYSGALSGVGGQWGWDEMNAWLKSPKTYVEGTKMGFAGLGKVEDRAAVALYMNEQGSNIVLPEFVPETPATEGELEEGAEAGAEEAQDAAEETSEETAAAQSAE